jgi:hypothetical protein
VSSAALRNLQGEIHACARDLRPDLFCFVTDDDVNVLGRHDAAGSLPPASCSTLGSFDFSRVPIPAAMMAMAKLGLEGFRATERLVRLGMREPS